jgi:hypothetical protein
MRYRIRSSDSHRVVLTFSMPERPLVILLLAAVSLVCLLLGLAYAVSPENPGDPLRALSFSGIGLFCLSAIFLFSTAYVTAFPSRLVFENDLARLELFDRKGASIDSIPYDGIAGFSVCRSVDDRVARHSFGFDMVRGGRWELYASQDRRKVKAFGDSMTSTVKLGARAAGNAAVARLSTAGRLALDRAKPGELRFAWRRKAHPFSLVVSLVVLLSFLAAIVGTRPFATGPGAYAVAVAFGAFFLLAALAGIFRTIGERMEVRIRRGSLDFSRRSALTRPRSFALTLSQVASVDFSMSFSRIGTRIVFLRPDEVERFVRCRQGTFSPAEVPGLISFLRGLPRIDVSGLPPADRLALAELIREAVQGDAPGSYP